MCTNFKFNFYSLATHKISLAKRGAALMSNLAVFHKQPYRHNRLISNEGRVADLIIEGGGDDPMVWGWSNHWRVMIQLFGGWSDHWEVMIQWFWGDPIIRGRFAYHKKKYNGYWLDKYVFFSSQNPLGPEIYVIKHILNLILKHYFFNVGGLFDNFLNNKKKTFYTLNIDRITKPQESNLKNISTPHIKNKKIKMLCKAGVTFSQILQKCVKSMQGISDIYEQQ